MAEKHKFIAFIVPNGIVPGQVIGGSAYFKISVSVCFHINEGYKGLDPDNQTGEASYQHFYDALQRLKTKKVTMVRYLSEIRSWHDIAHWQECSISEITLGDDKFAKKAGTDFSGIKETLWAAMFPPIKKVDINLSLEKPVTGPIHNLFGENNERLSHLNNFLATPLADFISNKTTAKKASPFSGAKTEAFELLGKINEHGMAQVKNAVKKQTAFIQKHYGEKFLENLEVLESESTGTRRRKSEVVKEYFQQLFELKNKALSAYLKAPVIDIDEVIHTYTAISNETMLMRIMGLIQDFEVNIRTEDLPEENESKVITLDCAVNELEPQDIMTSCSNFKIIRKNGKIAFLAADSVVEDPKATYYENSILLNAPMVNGVRFPGTSRLVRVDKLAIENKLRDRDRKIRENGELENDEWGDGLTRGLLFTNSMLHKIIRPPVFNQNPHPWKGLTDDFLVRGHRVGLIQYDKGSSRMHSLTSRKLEIKIDNHRKPVVTKKNFEGCIHFDTPSQYLQDGEPNGVIADVLFEYSGELLSLKSAFSKANKIDRTDKTIAELKYSHDNGLHKSKARFEMPAIVAYGKAKGATYESLLHFFHFPFNEIVVKPAYLGCFYDIPERYLDGNAPKLRFNNEYSCVVYQEYLNGWGLPLEPEKNSLQLSVKEIVEENETLYLPERIVFRPLENKKSPLFFHTKKVETDSANPKAAGVPLRDKDDLEHLVVRSDNASDSMQFVSRRHILPPKMDLEPAFWHGLLSPPRMNSLQSYLLKRKANCPFRDKDHYTEVSAKAAKGGCPEGCKVYCGGTHMGDFYTADHITPNFLADPTITGLNISLYWNKDCSEDRLASDDQGITVNFGGTPGISPFSISMKAIGSAGENFISKSVFSPALDIALKKGAQVYARIENHITAEAFEALFFGWWRDLKMEHPLDADRLMITSMRNVPKIIKLTHAVKEPLVEPKIKKIYSFREDAENLRYLNIWLDRKEYKGYAVGFNILSQRNDKSSGLPLINSSFARVRLEAHFERLDAIRKIGFLEEIIPTGGLELWMRKEEFTDDPQHPVLANGSPASHLPSEPVINFENTVTTNQFIAEHKIEFNASLLKQLKDSGNVEVTDGGADLFRNVVSSLTLDFDLKSTKFEEREYYLKNSSKFRGFFTNEKLVDDAVSTAMEKLEEYTLPKLKNVMNNLGQPSALRFKVLVLNNRKPANPEVAFAITTIREKRLYSGKKTESSQKGNIVTIYLKRGRLSSGKDERVGIIVDTTNGAPFRPYSLSPYNDYYKSNDYISKAGRDILTDRYDTDSILLKPGHIVTEGSDYDPGFDEELGIVHFLPKFDLERQLWKFEIELDITSDDGNQLHNPFINFSLVHFQPFSINYNNRKAAGEWLFENDCRVSAVENSTWCYLLPERKLSVYFDKPNLLFDHWGNVDLTVSFDYESLHHFNNADNNWIVRNNFILSVEGSDDKIVWNGMMSQLRTEENTGEWQLQHPLLTKQILAQQANEATINLQFKKWSNPIGVDLEYTGKISQKYSYFRVRFVEVEWFTHESWEDVLKRNSNLLSTDIASNEEMKIRFVELIY